MPNNQNFWECLYKKYQEKNKALLNREAELRYKVEAMEAVIDKNNYYKQQVQSKFLKAHNSVNKDKEKLVTTSKPIKKAFAPLSTEKSSIYKTEKPSIHKTEKPSIHKVPSMHPDESLKQSTETKTLTSEPPSRRKRGFFNFMLSFFSFSFLTKKKKSSQTSLTISECDDESEIKSKSSETVDDVESQNSYEISNIRPIKKSVINFILPERTSSLHASGSLDFESTSLGKILFEKCNQFEYEICQIDPMADLSETYDSVKMRSIRLALQLRKMGIRPTDIISTYSYNTMDSIIPSIACLFLGAKVFNLDPRVSEKNIIHLLSIVHPAVIFIEESLLPKFKECLPETKFKGRIVVFGNSNEYLKFSDLIKPDPEEDIFKPAKTHITDLAILVYSSGTTDLPKVVCHSNYSFLQILKMLYTSNITGDCALHKTTLSWLPTYCILAMTWITGGTRLFFNGDCGEPTLQIIEKYEVTVLFLPVFDTYNITDIENPERFDLSSLTKFAIGGSPVNGKQIEKLGNIFQNALILNCYGLAETGTVTTFDPEKHDKSFIESKYGSCGKLCMGASIKVVDVETNEVLRPHKKGELRIKSVGMMVDYYEVDSSDYFDNDDYFISGDIGYYDEDGYFYVIARRKEIFKYKGLPIVPSLIEQNLLEHPAVYDAAVFGVPYGEDGEAPTACIALKKDVQVDEKDIESFLKDRVADEEQLRGGIVFVTEIPRNHDGKVDLQELQELKNKSF